VGDSIRLLSEGLLPSGAIGREGFNRVGRAFVGSGVKE